MKTLQLILMITVLGIFSQSCRKGGPWGIKGKGETITETKNLSGFDKISVSLNADLVYTPDSVYKVEISAQENILAVLQAKVEDRTLHFEFRRNVWDYKKIKITVHSPAIKQLSVSGSGDITSQGGITADKMEMSISGSGDIYLPSLTANSLKCSVSGSGNMIIAGGTVKSETLSISGSGNVDVVKLVAQDALVKVSGSGEVSLQVTEELDVSISGSGDVRYKGKPSVSTSISGSGRLIHID